MWGLLPVYLSLKDHKCFLEHAKLCVLLKSLKMCEKQKTQLARVGLNH